MYLPLRYPRSVLAASLGLGICADYFFFERWLGVSVPLFVLLCLLILGAVGRVEDRLPQRHNLWFGAAALFFAVWVMVRAAPALVALNLLASFGLLFLLVVGYHSDSLLRLPVSRMIVHSLRAIALATLGPAPLAFQATNTLLRKHTYTRHFAPILLGLVLALPVLACFGGLLVAADRVFASYVEQLLNLRLPIDPLLILSHILFTLLATYACGGALLAALRLPACPAPESGNDFPAEGDTQRLSPGVSLQFLGCTEAVTILIAVNALFGAFMLVQAAYFFGGLDTLHRTGMTYASYARRGFFELLLVAMLTLALLWGLALVTYRDRAWQRFIFNAASGTMIMLVLGLLLSAFQRMLLYEQAYGFTRLRLYTQSFMVWLALVLLFFLLALLRARPQIFSWGSGAAALLTLTALNVLNPDALIVRENLSRFQAGGSLDAAYLATLSADAIPALGAALPTLAPQDAAALASGLAWQHRQLTAPAGAGWPSWHLARAQARTVLDTAQIPAAPIHATLQGHTPVR